MACIKAELAERAKRQDIGRTWRTAAALLRHGGKAAALFLFALLIGNAQTAQEATGAAQSSSVWTMYIMSTRKRLQAAIGRFLAFCESSVSQFRATCPA